MDSNWWNQALQSYDIGREHRADRENAEAFQTGGYDAVEQTAGARGDLSTAMTTRRFQDDRQNQAYEWFEQNAPYARNVLRRARAIQDPQQRATFLQSQRQRFEGIGFQPEQIDSAIQNLTNPETAEEAFASYDAAFTQHQDPNWQLVTAPAEGGGVEQRPAAITQQGTIEFGEGSLPVVPGEVQSFGSGGLYRQNPNNPQGYEVVREPRSVAGGWGGGGSSARPPSGYEWTEEGSLQPIPGGPAARGGQVDRQTRDRVRGLRELESALVAYSTALSGYEPGVGEAFGVGGISAEIDAASQILATQLNRSAFELGALAGPDYQIIVDAMGDPTNVQNLWRGGGPALRARLATVIQMVRNKRSEQERELRTLGIDPETIMGESVLDAPADTQNDPPPPSGRTRYDAQGRPIR